MVPARKPVRMKSTSETNFVRSKSSASSSPPRNAHGDCGGQDKMTSRSSDQLPSDGTVTRWILLLQPLLRLCRLSCFWREMWWEGKTSSVPAQNVESTSSAFMIGDWELGSWSACRRYCRSVCQRLWDGVPQGLREVKVKSATITPSLTSLWRPRPLPLL